MNEIMKDVVPMNEDMLGTRVAQMTTPLPEPSLLSIISRAASNPAMDIDKLERLLLAHERMTAQEAKKAYYTALSQVQTSLPVIPERGGIKNKSGEVQSTYALWEDVNDAIKPILAQYGLALSFRTGLEGDKIAVTGVLSHKDGHSEQTTIHLPSDTSGSKNAVQAVGSSTSYGKRYTAGALLNITSRGADDDGAAAGATGTIDDGELQHIRDLLDRTQSDPEKFCQHFKIEALPDLLKKDYNRAIQMLNDKLTNQKAGKK